MCIAHLGHLHHTLTQPQLNEIGRIDAVLFPVDGGETLDLDGMLEVLAALKAPIMIPMHSFSVYSLNRFVERARQTHGWDIEMADIPSVVLSKATAACKAQDAGAAGALIVQANLMKPK